MKLLNPKSLILISMSLLYSCSDTPDENYLTVEVSTETFSLVVPAIGEVEPVVTHKISSPGRQPKVIDWLISENETVTKGQVIARFDSEQVSLEQRKEELSMMLLDRDIQQKFAEKNKQQNELNSEDELIEKEFNFVDAYAIDDLLLYSKLEIIDSMSNKEYLGAKDEFIDWKMESLEERSSSVMEILDIRKQGHQRKYERHSKALADLEVYAPIDGIIIYEKNHRGEKPSIGQTVFPGATIASVPDLSSMQAKLFVIDKYAIGLSEGNMVSIRLDADYQQLINGKVTSVSGFPRTIKRGNPVKYYEVIVALEQQPNVTLLPGQKVSAEINVDTYEDKLNVPLQAIYNDNDGIFVYVARNGSIEKQPVILGVKNLFQAEITSGLQVGDRVVLNLPEDHRG